MSDSGGGSTGRVDPLVPKPPLGAAEARAISERLEADPVRFREVITRLHERMREAVRLLDGLPTRADGAAELDLVVAAMYRRTQRLYRATVLLIEHDLLEEAFIVARPLFTESLWLGELARAGSRRANLILGWLRASTTELEGMLLEGERASMTDPSGRLDAMRERQRLLERLAREGGVKGDWLRFPDEQLMATRQDRTVELLALRLAHQLAHGQEASHWFSTPTERMVLDAHVGAFAVRSALLGYLSAAAIFGWCDQDAVLDLLARVDEVHPAQL